MAHIDHLPRRPIAVAIYALSLAALSTSVLAQTAPPAEPTPASPPNEPASEPVKEPAATLKRVEVTGGRQSDTEARRQSTAAKIIIGREDIERHGDSTLGEILKRLPGVTMQGAPGRGGNIRLRGLGSGYTQILLDGERVPPGFSLDSLNPDQIERIEILRAPTAETGARAIAGTINIITREGYTKKLNELRLQLAYEHGRFEPNVSWTRNDSLGPLIYNVSLSAFHRRSQEDSTTTTAVVHPASGAPLLEQREDVKGQDQREGMHLSSRLQWKLGGGDQLMLSPFVVYSQGSLHRQAQRQELFRDPGNPPTQPLYDHSSTDGYSRFALTRLNGQYRQNLGSDTRLEWRGGLGLARSTLHTLRNLYDASSAPLLDAAGNAVSPMDDTSHVRERSGSLSLKLAKQFENDHSLVSGGEIDGSRRRETRTTLSAGVPDPALADFGDNLEASSLRLALYAQDEWNITPSWSAHAGLRWEGITTRGTGASETEEQRNRSSVWTPLLHAVWKPDPKSSDQLRMSLTRSYRSPTLASLIARPRTSTGLNSETNPDRAGNPALLPELATGIDVAVERYLSNGGLLSANVFYRRIQNLMRTLTTLEDVPWSAQPRWVARPRNVGDASTQGIELEAKFRLSDVMEGALPIDLRANASLFQSRVKSVPGPDNRLDQQPMGTANLGADYRLRSRPLTIGGNLNWTPAYDTRLSESQTAYQGKKLGIDAYGLWRFNPDLQLRVSASNLAALDYVTGGSTGSESSTTVAPSYVRWQLRLEMKL